MIRSAEVSPPIPTLCAADNVRIVPLATMVAESVIFFVFMPKKNVGMVDVVYERNANDADEPRSVSDETS
jgi:hypothetical protein